MKTRIWNDINVGDIVTPKTPAGLWLADVPTNGDKTQVSKDVCVFKGLGRVTEVFDCVIDYDEWHAGTEFEEPSLGAIEYRSCFVQFEGGGGWAGEGAVNKVDLYEYTNGDEE